MARVTSFDYGEVQLAFNIKMLVNASDVVNEEGKTPRMHDIKQANAQQEETTIRPGRRSRN